MAPASPTLSLDRQVKQFIDDVSGLTSEVEEREAVERKLISAPSSRFYSHIDAATSRTFFFDSSRGLSVWQRPAVKAIEEWTDCSPAAANDADHPFPLHTTTSTVKMDVVRLASIISQLLDRLAVAVGGQAEAMRVSAALLRLELRIRRGDWEVGEVSDKYVAERLADLLIRTEKELSAAESQLLAPPLPAKAETHVSEQATAAEENASDAPSQTQLEPAGAVVESLSAGNTSDVAVSTAPPPGVRRRAGIVSRPPSKPAVTLSLLPSSLPPKSVYPTPGSSSYSPATERPLDPGAAVTSGSKRRLEDSKGAVGAMVQRWKAVKRETKDEGSRMEQERQRQQEQRMRDAEAEVRSSDRAANNPNLITVTDDWRVRLREKQQQQLEQ